ALEIHDDKLPGGAPSAAYPSGTTFHPTFLYESLWNIGLCIFLLVLDRRVKLRPGRLMAVYVAGYALGRFWVESLRIDPANSGGGWRLNQWMAMVFFVGAAGFLLVDWWRHRNEPAPPEAGEVEPDYVAEDE
ncbi:MAG TPA: prolipoprotein diacylglyceryl transferase family protein, partial [Ilumatobacteraceae bacterium]|nr:prolipoprotein diacylglyceryl transferase family protein [Ilumatobacteraceae bacterium]